MRVRWIAERTLAWDLVVDRSAIQRAGRKPIRRLFDIASRFSAVHGSSVRLSHARPLDRGAIHDYGGLAPPAASPPCTEVR